MKFLDFKIDSSRINLFRVSFFSILLIEIISFWFRRLYFEAANLKLTHFKILDTLILKHLNQNFFYLLPCILLLLCLCCLLRISTKKSLLLFTFAYNFSYFISYHNQYQHQYLIGLTLFCLNFIDWEKTEGHQEVQVEAIGLSTLRILYGFVYFYAGFSKLYSGWEIPGSFFLFSFKLNFLNYSNLNFDQYLAMIVSFFAGVFQMTLGFLLVINRLKTLTFILATLFHIVILFLDYQIGLFSEYMITIWVLLYSPRKFYNYLHSIVKDTLIFFTQKFFKLYIFTKRLFLNKYIFNALFFLPWLIPILTKNNYLQETFFLIPMLYIFLTFSYRKNLRFLLPSLIVPSLLLILDFLNGFSYYLYIDKAYSFYFNELDNPGRYSQYYLICQDEKIPFEECRTKIKNEQDYKLKNIISDLDNLSKFNMRCFPGILTVHALLKYKNHETQVAHQLMNEALKCSDISTYEIHLMVVFYQLANRPDLALQNLNILSRSSKTRDKLEIDFYYSQILSSIQKNPVEVINRLENYRKHRYSTVDVLALLAENYYRIGKFNKAEELYLTLYDKTPNDKITCRLANLYLDIRQFDKSIDYFKKTLQLNPAHNDIYLNLALAYIEKNDIKSSIKNVKKHLKIFPSDENAKKILKQIQDKKKLRLSKN